MGKENVVGQQTDLDLKLRVFPSVRMSPFHVQTEGDLLHQSWSGRVRPGAFSSLLSAPLLLDVSKCIILDLLML